MFLNLVVILWKFYIIIGGESVLDEIDILMIVRLVFFFVDADIFFMKFGDD